MICRSDDLLIWRSDEFRTFNKSADQQIMNFFTDEIRTMNEMWHSFCDRGSLRVRER